MVLASTQSHRPLNARVADDADTEGRQGPSTNPAIVAHPLENVGSGPDNGPPPFSRYALPPRFLVIFYTGVDS